MIYLLKHTTDGRKSTTYEPDHTIIKTSPAAERIKTIARELGISKNTVMSYLAKLSQINWSVQEMLLLDDPVLETRFHAGNPAYKDPRYEHMAGKLDYFAHLL